MVDNRCIRIYDLKQKVQYHPEVGTYVTEEDIDLSGRIFCDIETENEMLRGKTMNDNKVLIPETLHWCREHYVTPMDKYITCSEFGHTDGMNGGCWWCMEMTPYQWYMCQDESWVRGLLSPIARIPRMTREEAVEFIEEYKQKHHMGNERKTPFYDNRDRDTMEDLVLSISKADVVEVKHGKWEWFAHNTKTRTCSVCHISQTVNIYNNKVMFNYCPYCGAKMDGRGDSDG